MRYYWYFTNLYQRLQQTPTDYQSNYMAKFGLNMGAQIGTLNWWPKQLHWCRLHPNSTVPNMCLNPLPWVSGGGVYYERGKLGLWLSSREKKNTIRQCSGLLLPCLIQLKKVATSGKVLNPWRFEIRPWKFHKHEGWNPLCLNRCEPVPLSQKVPVEHLISSWK